uniref:Uncharacterized protein n=1 Tax=Ananas comosus var. bracteatus TaxID=296719 RepID=A0A6V7PRV4_ANACO|nr:unnamed protein product [Ananas comosus var. bracteatus]
MKEEKMEIEEIARKDLEENERENNEISEQPEYMRSGYVRGMRPGPEPLENGGLRGQQLRAQIQAEIEVEMTARIQEEVEARMVQKESEVQARIEQREAEAEARLAQKEARLEQMEAQMRAVMQHLSEIGMPLSLQPTSANRCK